MMCWTNSSALDASVDAASEEMDSPVMAFSVDSLDSPPHAVRDKTMLPMSAATNIFFISFFLLT